MRINLTNINETEDRAIFEIQGKFFTVTFDNDRQLGTVVGVSDHADGEFVELTETAAIAFDLAVNHKIIDWLIYRGFTSMVPSTRNKAVNVSIEKKQLSFSVIDAVEGDRTFGTELVISLTREFKSQKPLLRPDGLPKTGAVEQNGEIWYPKEGLTIVDIDGNCRYFAEVTKTEDGFIRSGDERILNYVNVDGRLVHTSKAVRVLTLNGAAYVMKGDATSIVTTTTGELIQNVDTARRLGYEKNIKGLWYIPRDELKHSIVPWVRGVGNISGYHKGARVDMSENENFCVGIEVEKVDDYMRSFLDYKALEKYYGWTVETDSSLGENGFELISPKLPLMNVHVLTNHIESLAEILSADYDSRCGGHIHLSSKTIKHVDLFDGIAGFFPLLYAMYPDRAFKDACAAKKKDSLKATSSHGQSINLTRYNTVEFRIFPAVTGPLSVYRRLNLLRLFVNNLGTSIQDVNKMLYDKTELYDLLRSHYSKVDYNNIVDRLVYFSENIEQIKIPHNHTNLETL